MKCPYRNFQDCIVENARLATIKKIKRLGFLEENRIT